MLSQTEENYLKAVYKLTQLSAGKSANTSAIAQELGTTSASVTDMIKKLADKDLVEYEKYYGVHLTREGQKLALYLIRKHRLWEVFLYEKLNLKWEEVHDVAEQLEHVDSPLLIDRLDQFLGFPKFDPHGDPIPNDQGNLTYRAQQLLSQIHEAGQTYYVLAVKNQDPAFLKYLYECKLVPGSLFEIKELVEFDQSLKIVNAHKEEYIINNKVTQNLFVKQV